MVNAVVKSRSPLWIAGQEPLAQRHWVKRPIIPGKSPESVNVFVNFIFYGVIRVQRNYEIYKGRFLSR